MSDNKTYMIPTSRKEIDALGWDFVDIIIFSGDAFIDHPSFGSAVVARYLQSQGYRVAVVPQPNWRDDLRDFRKLGRPRLFFGVNAGVMDSMVNHYTANKRLRSDDAYTPDGRAGQRPDYAVTVYSRILKQLYPDVPVIIGGIEASLRRFTHYDYWSDTLRPSVLVDSGADYLSYGMGERTLLALAKAYEHGEGMGKIRSIPQLAWLESGSRYAKSLKVGDKQIELHSFEECQRDPKAFAENFHYIELEANRKVARRMIECVGDRALVVNPPYEPETPEEIDRYYDLPYTKAPHPRYKGKHIPAYEMIKFSINTHRGCFGGCNFCTIAAHQGKFIRSRSAASIQREVKALTHLPDFKGVVSDIGGPTANMYGLKGKNQELCGRCVRKSCLFPNRCENLQTSHEPLLALYHQLEQIPGIKRLFIGSGIRYDLFLNRDGFVDASSEPYLKALILKHTSGRLKVAPEHTEDHVLKLMAKPTFDLFVRLRHHFDRITAKAGLHYQLVPYFISSHPGCRMEDMQALSRNPALKGLYMDQVQDFMPTPMTASSVMFYTGLDLKTGKPLFVERNQGRKRQQKSFFFKKNSGNRKNTL